MEIKNIFYLFILLASHPTYGMKKLQKNQSTSSTQTMKLQIRQPSPFVKPLQKIDLNSPQYLLNSKINLNSPEYILISKIEYEINMDTNPSTMLELLSQPQAKLLDSKTKENLYAQAETFEKLLTTKPDEPSHVYATTKKNYLYAFKFFSQFIFPQEFFTPIPYKRLSDKRPYLNQILEALVKNEQEKIYVCCYHLTLRSLAEALLEQKNKGISIEIVTNQSQGKNQSDWSMLTNLKNEGISVLSPQNDKFEQMHHKFFIFKKNLHNKSLIVTGSYNPTSHGDTNSWDDIIVLDDQNIINKYIKRFEEVKSRSK